MQPVVFRQERMAEQDTLSGTALKSRSKIAWENCVWRSGGLFFEVQSSVPRAEVFPESVNCVGMDPRAFR